MEEMALEEARLWAMFHLEEYDGTNGVDIPGHVVIVAPTLELARHFFHDVVIYHHRNDFSEVTKERATHRKGGSLSYLAMDGQPPPVIMNEGYRVVEFSRAWVICTPEILAVLRCLWGVKRNLPGMACEHDYTIVYSVIEEGQYVQERRR